MAYGAGRTACGTFSFMMSSRLATSKKSAWMTNLKPNEPAKGRKHTTGKCSDRNQVGSWSRVNTPAHARTGRKAKILFSRSTLGEPSACVGNASMTSVVG